VITDRISPFAPVYAVSRPFEMVYDYPMYIISDVEDNQVYLTINMVVHQTMLASYMRKERKGKERKRKEKNI
jgi:hypothetical protein